MSYISVNPATEEVIAEFALHSDEYIDEALDASTHAFVGWRATPFDKRSDLMKSAADVLERESDEVAMMLTSEMGKTLTSAKAEVAKCVSTMRYFAQHAESLLCEEVIASSARYSGIRYEPLGTVLAVMPWNYALWQAIRFSPLDSWREIAPCSSTHTTYPARLPISSPCFFERAFRPASSPTSSSAIPHFLR